MISRKLVRSGWTNSRLLFALLLTIAGVIVTSNSWRDIAWIAIKDEESSQILLVPLVFAWLFWVRRDRVRQFRPRASLLGPLLVLAGLVCYAEGDWHFTHYMMNGGAVIVAVGCAVSVLGKDLLFKFLPAFLSLAFLVPIPGRVRQKIAVPMQTATAEVTQAALVVMGVPVERAGSVLQINGIDVAIDEGCNGLRMISALVLVSYGFAFGTPLRSYARFLVIASSPLSALLCNVVRLIPTVWVYGNCDTTFAARFHDATGWVMLVVSFLILMAIIRTLRWALVPVSRFTLAYD